MNWSDKTQKLAGIQKRIDANETEKFALRDEYRAAQELVGCEHDRRHHYSVAIIPPRYGCYECDRELAEQVRGERP